MVAGLIVLLNVPLHTFKKPFNIKEDGNNTITIIRYRYCRKRSDFSVNLHYIKIYTFI